jgi:hypothetical protein
MGTPPKLQTVVYLLPVLVLKSLREVFLPLGE